MSDFYMYELQDNVWDEFCKTDDHIVPHPGDDHKEQFAIPGDSCKKSTRDLHGIRRFTDYMSNYGTKGKEELYVPYLDQKEIMMEKGSWSNKPEGLFSSGYGDSLKELKSLTSENTRMSDHCFKSSNVYSSGSEICLDDAIVRDKYVAEDDMSQYSISNISQTDNELSFLDNDMWLDIGNFEDVDRTLSCDLTFGMGSLSNEEEFCWLSPSHGTEGSDDVLKSGFKFSSAEVSPLKSVSDYNIDLKENIEGLPINGFSKKTSPINKNLSSQMDVHHDSVPTPLSTFSESNLKSSITDDLIPKEKIQGKLSKPSSGKRKNDCLENGDSVHPYAHVEQYANLKQPFETTSSGVISQDSIHQHRPNMNSDSIGCIQIQTSLTHPDDDGHTPNYTSLLPAMSGSRPELNRNASIFKESLYVSSMESSHGHPLEPASFKANDKRENLNNCHSAHLLSRGFKNENIASPVQFQSPGSAQLVGHQFENENEGHSEVEGVSIGFSQEIDSSNVQESSSMSSALDEISLEATSFRQLLQVMEKLDIKTKLCIRDSLYRLAKSAEQRHDDVNVMGQIGDNVETSKAIMTQGENRCTGFMDIETNTNPIDRSIAHLLFHRPSDPSVLLPLNDTAPFRSRSMVHGSVIHPHVMTEKQVCQEESSAGVDKSLRVTSGEK